MKVLIPYREKGTKSSLKPIFNEQERKKLSRYMLDEISDKFDNIEKYIVSPDFEKRINDFKIYKSSLGLNEALEEAISDLGLPVLIIPSDIPLIKKNDIKKIMEFEEDIIISPGEREGTNALMLRKKIPLKYSGKSFQKHIKAIKKRKISYHIYKSNNIYKDLDKPKDIKGIIENLPKNNKLRKWLTKKISSTNTSS